MIKSLHAVNFRRHADLQLRFDDERQLILIAGANGTGKSTILEAITFALYGEGRHGRRNLDGLVRRGAELEGMSVEMTFTIGKDLYRVHRRRDGRSVTAVLYANDTPLVEGPVAVTAEISALLGMDAAGFRLAVIAQQKDLDGLASLRPAERAQMVTRLLRLDALTAARNVASARFRTEREIAAGLRDAELAPLQAELEAAGSAAASTGVELDASRDALSALEAEIAANADVESAWSEATSTVARLEGALAEIAARRRDLSVELSGLHPVEVTIPTVDVDELTREIALVERKLALAETVERDARNRRVAEEELERVRVRAGEITSRLAVLRSTTPEAATGVVDDARRSMERVEQDVVALREEIGALRGRHAEVTAKIDESGGLGAECDRCGQCISDEHRERQIARLDEQARELAGSITRVQTRLDAALARLEGLHGRVDAARAELDAVKADTAERLRLLDESGDLERRARIYTAQMERLVVAPVDVVGLRNRRAELASAASQVGEHQKQVRLRDAVLTRRSEIHVEVDRLDRAAAEQQERILAARPSEDLSARYQARRVALERRDAERSMLAHWETEHAVAVSRAAQLRQRIDEAQAREERRRRHESTALHAAAAARLLGEVSERLGTQLRPSLQAAVSQLLETMSEGRFSAVRISDDYTITVDDDGTFRPLSELSGGEVDLVALAVRLALAQVVSDRHGSGGPGFLILDECFASQDAQRRQSILDALRTLRDVYSQIFIISHVENIEDAADMVVSVSTDDDRQETEVVVS